MEKNFLIEEIDLDSIENIIEEEVINENKKEKSYYIKGVFLEADIKNGNGRIYPLKIIEREIENFNNLYIKTNRAVGELGHPENLSINLDRVSHLITELKLEKNFGIGKAKIIDTPFGQIAKKLMENGVKLGVSSRGVGTLKENIVQSDYSLKTIDIVHSPSAPNAFVDCVLESEWVVENGILTEKQRNLLKKKLDEDVRKSKYLEEAIEKSFKNFIKIINKINIER